MRGDVDRIFTLENLPAHTFNVHRSLDDLVYSMPAVRLARVHPLDVNKVIADLWERLSGQSSALGHRLISTLKLHENDVVSIVVMETKTLARVSSLKVFSGLAEANFSGSAIVFVHHGTAIFIYFNAQKVLAVDANAPDF